MLAIYHDFLVNKLDLKDSVKTWNKTIFGIRLRAYCREDTGISKMENDGADRTNKYTFTVTKLQSFLERKGLLNRTSYMFLDTSDLEDDDLDNKKYKD